MGSLGFFLFFKSINRGGHPNVPASVNKFTVAAQATAAVKPRLTVTLHPQRTPFPARENGKRPPRIKFL
jgi:hypothetical protein